MGAPDTHAFFAVLGSAGALFVVALLSGIVLAFQKSRGLRTTGRWIAGISAVLILMIVFFPVTMCGLAAVGISSV